MFKSKKIRIVAAVAVILALNILLLIFLLTYYLGVGYYVIGDQTSTEWYSENKNIHFAVDKEGQIFGTAVISGEQIPFKADYSLGDNFLTLYSYEDSDSEDLLIARYKIEYKFKKKDKFKAKLKITNYDFPLEEKTVFYKASEKVTEDYIAEKFKTGDN